MSYHVGQLVVVQDEVVSLIARVNTMDDWKLSRKVKGSDYANEQDIKPAPGEVNIRMRDRSY